MHCSGPLDVLTLQQTARAEAYESNTPVFEQNIRFVTHAQPIASTQKKMLKAAFGAGLFPRLPNHDLARAGGPNEGGKFSAALSPT